MSDNELIDILNTRIGMLCFWENLTDDGFIATNQAIAQMIIAREKLTAKSKSGDTNDTTRKD